MLGVPCLFRKAFACDGYKPTLTDITLYYTKFRSNVNKFVAFKTHTTHNFSLPSKLLMHLDDQSAWDPPLYYWIFIGGSHSLSQEWIKTQRNHDCYFKVNIKLAKSNNANNEKWRKRPWKASTTKLWLVKYKEAT